MYSFKKGFVKGVISALTVAAALAAFAGLSDITLWSLVETYLKPVLGAMTLGGLITMLLNWLKNRSA